METKTLPVMIPAAELQVNPANPRSISDEQMNKLMKSIVSHPKMMFIREVVINDEKKIIGGTQRYLALGRLREKSDGEKKLIYQNQIQGRDEMYKHLLNWVLFEQTVPVKVADGFTDDEEEEFIFRDNVSMGEWDWGIINDYFDTSKLPDYGIMIPDFGKLPDDVDLTGEPKALPNTMKITFKDTDQLRKLQPEIDKLIEGLDGCFYSISAGEL